MEPFIGDFMANLQQEAAHEVLAALRPLQPRRALSHWLAPLRGKLAGFIRRERVTEESYPLLECEESQLQPDVCG